MKVIICGAGQVGYGIAEHLSAEGNDVSVIDSDPALIAHLQDTLDVRGIEGHGAHPDVLETAGAREADMIIAVTFYDEVNMVACQVAHSLFNIPTKIARVRAQSYRDPQWQNLFSRDHMPIDVIISPEVEVGEMVMRRLAVPGAFEAVPFGDGQLMLLGLSCDEDCPILDTPLTQLTELFPDLFTVVVGICRGNKLFAPHGNDQLLAGDDVYVITRTDHAERTLKIFGHQEKRAQRVIIAGGGNIGLYVAQRVEAAQSDTRLKIVEIDQQRAQFVADAIRRTVVLHGSALDEELLREADAPLADLMVALTNDDQVNLLSSVLAKHLGCQRALCLLNNRSFSTIVRSLGIDAHLDPRAITVSRILQHVRRGRIRAVHAIRNGAAEIIEAEALQTSYLVGRPLRDIDLPEGVRLGAVLRKDTLFLPNGKTVVEEGDRVILFVTKDHVREVEKMFRVSLEYF